MINFLFHQRIVAKLPPKVSVWPLFTLCRRDLCFIWRKLKRKIWNVAWICPYKSFHKWLAKWNWQVISLHYFLHSFFPIFWERHCEIAILIPRFGKYINSNHYTYATLSYLSSGRVLANFVAFFHINQLYSLRYTQNTESWYNSKLSN